jgi:hypothetical protein
MTEYPIIVKVLESYPLTVGNQEIRRRIEKVINVSSCSEKNDKPITDEEFDTGIRYNRNPRFNEITCEGNVFRLQKPDQYFGDEIMNMLTEEILDNNKQMSIEEISVNIPSLNYKVSNVTGMQL